MTQGDIFTHLELFDASTQKTVAGAFRDVELWSPDSKRFTLWLHPGRQKTGVNLNEDEGPVLIEGHRYQLRLKQSATTTDGHTLPSDAIYAFTAGPADHAMPDAHRWIVNAPQSGTCDPLTVMFDEPLDWSMLHTSIHLPANIATKSIAINDAGTQWQCIPQHAWQAGSYTIEIDPHLEDLAGNNLIQPFEVDTTTSGNASSNEPVKLSFEVKPSP
jgi:hypothetical protein